MWSVRSALSTPRALITTASWASRSSRPGTCMSCSASSDQDLPLGFTVRGQLAVLSDRNFLEQFYPNDFMNGPNQESFVYVKQQNNNWAWTFLTEANLQRWMSTTDWLPKADGYVQGLKIFDLFTYDVHASAGYGQLRPPTVAPFAYQPTEQRDNTGRFDIWQ